MSYILICLTCFSGIFLGAALGKIAPEELVPGKKYMRLLQRIILPLLVSVAAYSFIGIWGIIMGIPFTFLGPRTAYVVMGVIMSFTQFSDNAFLIFTLVFLYGFPTGTIETDPEITYIKLFKNIIRRYLHFLLLCSLSIVTTLLLR